jgi:hypothetical protein
MALLGTGEAASGRRRLQAADGEITNAYCVEMF